jgi:hypothetical protein
MSSSWGASQVHGLALRATIRTVKARIATGSSRTPEEVEFEAADSGIKLSTEATVWLRDLLDRIESCHGCRVLWARLKPRDLLRGQHNVICAHTVL